RDGRANRFTEVRMKSAELEVPVERSASNAPAPQAAPIAPPTPPPTPPPAPPRKGGRTARKTAAAPLPVAAPLPPPTAPSKSGVRGGYAEQAVALRDRLVRFASWSTEHIAPDAPVEIQGLTIVLTTASQRLNLGPGPLRVAHDARGLEVNFSPGQSDANAKG